jgi:hypothetical protein
MTVMITGDVPGQTKEGYEGTLVGLGEALRKAPGFILHTGHAIDGGWRVIEVWESPKAASDWFAKAVRPFLPPNIKPHRVVQELHTFIRP